MKKDIYDIFLDETNPDQGVSEIALVDDPAIGVKWFAFRKENPSEESFKLADESKQMLAGPLLIPDIEISRLRPDGSVYYIRFSKDQIEKIATRFMKNRNTGNFNVMHTETKANCFINEVWLVNDPANDKSSQWGLVPAGTWFSIVHVPKKEDFDSIKKNLRGFSIEAILNQIPVKMNKQTKLESEITVKGDLAVGSDVTVVGADGVEAPAPDGEYFLPDGKKIVVTAGKISEIIAELATETADKTEDLAALKTEFLQMIADLNTRLQKLESSENKLKEELAAAKANVPPSKTFKATLKVATAKKEEKKEALKFSATRKPTLMDKGASIMANLGKR